MSANRCWSTFCRAASGDYELDRPDQLTRLLGEHGRDRLISRARLVRRLVRDVGGSRQSSGGWNEWSMPIPRPARSFLAKRSSNCSRDRSATRNARFLSYAPRAFVGALRAIQDKDSGL